VRAWAAPWEVEVAAAVGARADTAVGTAWGNTCRRAPDLRSSTRFVCARARIACGEVEEGVPPASGAATLPVRVGFGWSTGRKEGNRVPPPQQLRHTPRRG
jgi:hypothetical protein